MSDIVFWVAQAVGLCALAFSMRAYQSKTKEELLGTQMAGSLVYVLHFALLSAWTGVAMNALVGVRNWIFIKRDSHRWAANHLWMWFFMGLAVVFLFLTWQGYISLLPFIGILLGVYSRWHSDSASQIRIYSGIGCMLWIPYDLTVHSYTGFIADTVTLLSIIYGIWRHDRLKKVEGMEVVKVVK